LNPAGERVVCRRYGMGEKSIRRSLNELLVELSRRVLSSAVSLFVNFTLSRQTGGFG
jgi:hypothetical protein